MSGSMGRRDGLLRETEQNPSYLQEGTGYEYHRFESYPGSGKRDWQNCAEMVSFDAPNLNWSSPFATRENAFSGCAKLRSIRIGKFISAGAYVFSGTGPQLRHVVLGGVGESGATTMHPYAFKGLTQKELTIEVYVADETAIPLANQPWGAANAAIIYRSTTTGEERTT